MVLAPALVSKLVEFYQLLAHWNRRINLTAFALDVPSDAALDRLFIEPVQAASCLPSAPLPWFDLGSGGGSPALPMKIVHPEAELTMVESRSRKAAFLREAVRTLGLDGARVLNARVEAVAGRQEFQGAVRLVTVRALRIDRMLLEACRRLLGPDGRLLVFGRQQSVWSGFESFGWRLQSEVALLGGSRLLILSAQA